jgi:hypothetical protein
MGSLYGFEVESELPLRRLNAASGTRGTLRVDLAMSPLTPPNGLEPVGFLEDGQGRRWYASYALDDERRLLQMPPTGSFLLEPGAGRVAVERTDEDDELLEHRIASSAICTLLAEREDLVLHAAGVEHEDRAIVFCGPSLRGKSTLARALGEAGCRLLGEDGIAIELGDEGPRAFPGARGVRVRGRDDDGRHRTDLLPDPGPDEPGPCPVAAVVLLEARGPAFEVERLERARALALLTSNLVHSGGRGALAATFARLASLLAVTPTLSVSLPDDLAALPAAAEKLLDSVQIRG